MHTSSVIYHVSGGHHLECKYTEGKAKQKWDLKVRRKSSLVSIHCHDVKKNVGQYCQLQISAAGHTLYYAFDTTGPTLDPSVL